MTSYKNVVALVMPWVGWISLLKFSAASSQALPEEAIYLLKLALQRHGLDTAGNFRQGIKRLFRHIVDPVLNLSSNHAPRPPYSLVRAERRVRCRYYDGWQYPFGQPAPLVASDLDHIFL